MNTGLLRSLTGVAVIVFKLVSMGCYLAVLIHNIEGYEHSNLMAAFVFLGLTIILLIYAVLHDFYAWYINDLLAPLIIVIFMLVIIGLSFCGITILSVHIGIHYDDDSHHLYWISLVFDGIAICLNVTFVMLLMYFPCKHRPKADFSDLQKMAPNVQYKREDKSAVNYRNIMKSISQNFSKSEHFKINRDQSIPPSTENSPSKSEKPNPTKKIKFKKTERKKPEERKKPRGRKPKGRKGRKEAPKLPNGFVLPSSSSASKSNSNEE